MKSSVYLHLQTFLLAYEKKKFEEGWGFGFFGLGVIVEEFLFAGK